MSGLEQASAIERERSEQDEQQERQRWHSRRRLWVLAAGAFFLLVLGVIAFATLGDVGEDELGEVDSNVVTVPAFTLPALEAGGALGDELAISELGEEPIFLYFWASWCYPCELETPVIQELWESEYRDRGVRFIGINILDSPTAAAEFAERHGVTFPMLHDAEGDAYIEFGVDGVPEAYFVTPGLDVQRRYIGQLHEDDLRSMLDALLEASASGATAAEAPSGERGAS